MKILQIVGYKNSGKTTLIQDWIKECRKLQLEVAVIKHHGHKDGLELPTSNTDSMKFFDAGAISSVVVDDQTIQLHQSKKNWSLQKLVELTKLTNPDILLIEGFKEAHYPKVVIVKNRADWEALSRKSNIILVLIHKQIHLEACSIDILSLTDRGKVNEWLVNWIN